MTNVNERLVKKTNSVEGLEAIEKKEILSIEHLNQGHQVRMPC